MISSVQTMLRVFSSAVLAAAIVSAQSSTQTTLQDPPAEANAAFLFRLGLDDTEESSWNGSLFAGNGDLVQLTGYEFRVGDLIHPPRRWEARSRKGHISPPRAMYEEHFKTPSTGTILSPSFHAYLRTGPATNVRVETAQGDFTFRTADVAIGATKLFLDERVSVEHVVFPVLVGRGGSYSDSERRGDYDYPAIAVTKDGAAWVSWQGYNGEGDHVFAEKITSQARIGPGRRPHQVTAAPGDVYRTAIAADSEGKIWVVWSERVKDNWDLFARAYDGQSWSSPERLTRSSQPDTQHRLAAGPDGKLHLVWQGYREGRAAIFHRTYNAEEGWGRAERVSTPEADNCWEPALAVDPNGNVFVAWDQYGPDGYDIWMRPQINGRWRDPVPVATTAHFEAHVSMTADPAGRVWLAWDEAGVNWGKDFGYPRDITLPGTGLYQSRRLKMAVWEQGRLRRPARSLHETLPPTGADFHELPELAAGKSGRVWAFFRHRTQFEINVPNRTPSHYALWTIQASYYEGSAWSPVMTLPYSTGLNDQRMRAAAGPDGGVVAAWPTDRRNVKEFGTLQPDVFLGRMPRPLGSAPPPVLADYEQDAVEASVVHPNDDADVARIRNYVYEVNGRRYRIYRGDMHRHTEFSWDGYNDGSLQDAYRYAIDAAGLDYLAVTEHIWGARHEYDWWRVQKAVDLHRVGTRFTPLFGYERSVTFPNGHRNIIFSYRGVEEFDIQGHELAPSSYDRHGAERLFAYLRRYKGISMPHTSGTNMGTNWRDWDSEVEPVVEIYQGDRNSYETAGGWRSADPDDPRTQHGGYQPEGMVSNAWAKGYRLGVQASSDHMATHTSYAMILAPENTREALTGALRARHSYGATDNIILDFRLVADDREYLMGEEAELAGVPRFRIHAEGTAPIAEAELIKNNQVVFSQQPNQQAIDFEYQDNEAPGEEADFYYLRVRQSDQDKQIAWSSPIWVRSR